MRSSAAWRGKMVAGAAFKAGHSLLSQDGDDGDDDSDGDDGDSDDGDSDGDDRGDAERGTSYKV